MKTMKWTLLFSAFSFALVMGLSGCSDDTGTPNPKPNDQGGVIADTGGISGDTGGILGDTGGGTGGYGSCTVGVDPNKICNNYVGSSYDGTVADSCKASAQGTWSTSACDTAGAVGYCTLNAGTVTEMETYYYGTMGATAGETACTVGKGTWHTI
ncbi:MAG: hypothetical protein KAI47_05770 [Deltaproteobacteria bacterium]|nr:hypothetical protein [Deltaproteobacteria bacterium]